MAPHARQPRQWPQRSSYQEFALSDYYRQFRLHEEVDQEKISAELKQDVLRVFLPRREEVKPRQVPVKIH